MASINLQTPPLWTRCKTADICFVQLLRAKYHTSIYKEYSITVYLSINVFFSLFIFPYSFIINHRYESKHFGFSSYTMSLYLYANRNDSFLKKKKNKCNTVYDFPWFESYLGIQNRLISTEHVGALRPCKCTLHRFQSLFDKQSHRNIVCV